MIEIGIPCEANDQFALDAVLDAIAAAMLWSKDERRLRKFVFERYIARTAGLPQDGLTLDFFQNDHFSDNFPRGLAAGFVLRNAVAKLHFQETFKLNDFKSVFSEISLFGYSTKTMDNDVWRRFRGVSPLWASHIILIEMGVVDPGIFPCMKESLPDLITIAESLKREGQKHTPRSRERSLLRNTEGYVLSKTVAALVPILADSYSLDFVKPQSIPGPCGN